MEDNFDNVVKKRSKVMSQFFSGFVTFYLNLLGLAI